MLQIHLKGKKNVRFINENYVDYIPYKTGAVQVNFGFALNGKLLTNSNWNYKINDAGLEKISSITTLL